MAGGNYTFIVDQVEISGRGKYYEQFKKLYEKLEKKDYFSLKYKKKLKRFPEKIGVITSYTGAAIQDILSVFNRRYPVVEVYVYDTQVQGQEIESGIVKAIKFLDNMNLDVIIITRGGGDSDNLAAFNSEIIADACFNCTIPIISAIGHEIDFVIIDYVADFRAPTPSVAAEIAVPNINDIFQLLDENLYKNNLYFLNRIEYSERKIQDIKYLIANFSPIAKIIDYNHHLQLLHNKIISRYNDIINYANFNLDSLKSKIISNNPLKILESGYSIVEKDGETVKFQSEIANVDELDIKFYDGKIKTKIEVIKREKYE